MPTRVLLCYPDRLIRVALRSMLESRYGIQVVEDVGDGWESLSSARSLRPDIVVVDEGLPDMAGLEFIRRLWDDPRNVAIRVIIVCARVDAMVDAIRAGVRGFLLRSSGPEELAAAIDAVADGQAFLTPQAASVLLRELTTVLRIRQGGSAQLTEREREVLSLVAEGFNNAEIAEALVLSEATIKFHVSNLLGKLDLRDRLQIAVYAYKTGITGQALPSPHVSTVLVSGAGERNVVA